MSIKQKIRVLVVDDSLVFREALSKELTGDSGIEVVGTAADPFMAKDRLAELRPQVMTLDIEMPKMNGIEFLRRLMPQYPIPVVVVSSASDRVFDALNAGAVDFVTKPEHLTDHSFAAFINELIVKIKIASTAKVGFWKEEAPRHNPTGFSAAGNSGDRVIAIGASTGGTEAIAYILKELPPNLPGIVIVQHMPPVFTRMYAERLNNNCLLEVKEAQNGDQVLPGRVLIAPGDQHMRLQKSGSGLVVECFPGEKVNGHCPSVDVLFQSAAEKMGNKAVGVILTGMGYDGAKSLLEMRKRGAVTFGQDEASCVVYGMPKVAYEIGAVERQMPLAKIPEALCLLFNQGR